MNSVFDDLAQRDVSTFGHYDVLKDIILLSSERTDVPLAVHTYSGYPAVASFELSINSSGFKEYENGMLCFDACEHVYHWAIVNAASDDTPIIRLCVKTAEALHKFLFKSICPFFQSTWKNFK